MAKIHYLILGAFLLLLGGGHCVSQPCVGEDCLPSYARKIKPTIEQVYLSQVGVREATGKNDGKEVEKYLRAVGLGKGHAWCAAFVRWCLDQAGVKTRITAWSPSAHNSRNLVFFDRKIIQEPRPGDVGCLYYPRLKRIGHTYFYHRRVNDKVYQSVEGNTNEAGSREGDGVYKKYRSFNATYSISRWEN